MRRSGSRPGLFGLLALGMSAIMVLLAGCGGDGDDEADRTDTQTVAADDEATGTGIEESETVPSFTEAEVETATTDALRAFNRTVNLGDLDGACQTYFSVALLAAAEAQGGCVPALALIRGEGKVQISVGEFSVFEDVPGLSGSVGVTPATANVRNFDFTYEDGAWKLDAVLDVYSAPIVAPPENTTGPFTIEAEPDGTETGSEAPVSEAEAEAAITAVILEFNGTANAGDLQGACQGYFSAGFLARLPGERDCATTLAGARGGGGRVEVEVFDFSFDESEPERAEVVIRLDRPKGFKTIGGEFRDLQMVFENGAWKIDAVTTGPV